MSSAVHSGSLAPYRAEAESNGQVVRIPRRL
jgi:hypothetical protein